MRILFILSCLFFVSVGFGQSLKDSLFSGKLKVDSALIRKSKIQEQPKKDTDTIQKSSTDSTLKQATTGQPVMNYQDNNKVWKKFVDQYTSVINKESLPSKKMKRGTYSVLIEYEIGPDGVVTTTNITSTPSSEYLVDQVREKMMANAPQLAPLIRNGKPTKSLKKQLLVFTKEKN